MKLYDYITHPWNILLSNVIYIWLICELIESCKDKFIDTHARNNSNKIPLSNFHRHVHNRQALDVLIYLSYNIHLI